ncbi:response regulator [Flavobacterium sp. 123]|uniref:response regulator n=1 Tax=Flavobacterium sp. 123 TaxID=2135627 RepID=UPI000EB4B284|nr:response regulator [Flavobacterium sp. 123]RKS98546.1 signal transduction histidine kinase [Flavobacterium sp. 123]
MKRVTSLNTYFKILLLIISTNLLFFLLYLSLYFYTIQEEKQFYKTTFNQYNKEVQSLFELNSQAHTARIVDVSFWDELVDFTKTKDKNWYDKFSFSQIDSYEVDYIGIYDLKGELIGESTTSNIKTSDFIPRKLLPGLYKSKLTKFYLKVPDGIVEVFGATIHPSNDPLKNKFKPSGYFFMARLLNKKFFENLGAISSSSVGFVDEQHLAKTTDNFVDVTLDLKDWENKSVSKILFQRSFNLNYRNSKDILFIIVFASIINILIYLYYTKKWVYNPLNLIKDILETGNTHAIHKLRKARGEFTNIANLFEENDNQQKQLELSKRKAEENDKLKSSFLANLSHEIRTPMNAIIGFSDLLHDADIEEKERLEYLKIIKNSGVNLVSIIEDLIEMSKIDARQILPNYKAVDIEACIHDLYDSIKVTIPKDKQIQFYVEENPENISGNILTDEVKLKQILINLITNAIKFTEKGSVSFGYTVNKMRGVLEFKVTDSGLGINENNLKIIFDRFRRLEDDYSVESSGLGLGLSITKAYVEMLGGRITVNSAIGVGSTFVFEIPLQYDLSEKKTPLISTIDVVPSNSGNQTILVAEDDNINFLLLKKILELKKYVVLRAINGQEAVDICKANSGVDLVFMDIKMPVLNGYEALKKIKEFLPNLPIIAQTAHSSLEDKEEMLQAGFTDYITKPLDKEKIFKLLEKIFT